MKKQRIPLDPRWENVVSFVCVKMNVWEQHSRLQRPSCTVDIVPCAVPDVKYNLEVVERA